MKHWIVDDAPDCGRWMLYDENSSDDNITIHVRGSKALAQRVADGLNEQCQSGGEAATA